MTDGLSAEQFHAADLAARLFAGAAFAAGAGTLEELTQALRHDDPEVRWRAAVALGWRGESAAAAPLLALLTEDYAVKINAVWALGMIGGAVVEHLLAVIRAPGDGEPDIRYVAALALARLGYAGLLADDLNGSSEPAFRVAHAALATARLSGQAAR